MASYPLPPAPPSIDTSPISKGRVSITHNLLSKQQVEALLEDAKSLYRTGAFVPGGLRRSHNRKSNSSNNKDGCRNVFMKTTNDETKRICEICGIFDDALNAGPKVGNIDAREELLDLMGDLRDLLQTDLGIRLSESMELQYLRYPGSDDGRSKKSREQVTKKNGFYGRHFDSSPEDESTCRRKVSLLLYLNDETWDTRVDGGLLRAYLPQQQQQATPTAIMKRKRSSICSDEHDKKEEDSIQDITPKGGTLVLFDSASVEHEVLQTYRERWAVVGWFLAEDTALVRSTSQDQSRRRKKRKRRG